MQDKLLLQHPQLWSVSYTTVNTGSVTPRYGTSQPAVLSHNLGQRQHRCSQDHFHALLWVKNKRNWSS